MLRIIVNKNKFVKVIDMVSGVEVGINQQGLILLRGQTVVSPYWKDDKATFEDFQRNGWRNTGIDLTYFIKINLKKEKRLLLRKTTHLQILCELT